MFNTIFSEISVEQQEIISGGKLLSFYRNSLDLALDKSAEVIKLANFLVHPF
jgi:hypothetical protein